MASNSTRAGRTNQMGRMDALAIVGIGCRFPGNVSDPNGLWELLQRAEDAITEVPRERFDIDAFYDPRPGTPGKLVTRWGGFLPDVDRFDAGFFGISPREAIAMDPQQRLLLEVAWEAIEDAGQLLGALQDERTGVFVGMINSDYRDLEYRNRELLDIHVGVGTTRSVMAGRVSYALGLTGPSIVVDTACSSSLVALHLACASIRAGECSRALVAGVNLILQPDESIPFSRAGMLSPEGRCKFGDAKGNGFVRSDGVGVLLIEPLARAREQGDSIYSLILGSAVNNDGDGSLLMTPSRRGQAAVLRQAYAAAAISPADVQYVEAHGTGTSVGDPIELGAIGDVIGAARDPRHPCLCGSVKTNIGHCEGAAGIAGLIKTSLALAHRSIPPSLHVETLNPAIPWQDLGVAIAQAATPWPDAQGKPARAGVSSFGLGGTNAHVILEEPPATHHRYRVPPGASPQDGAGPQEEERARVLALSARSAEALTEMASRYRSLLAGGAAQGTPRIADICHTAGVRRAHHPHRIAVVGRTHAELGDALEAFLDGAAQLASTRGSGQARVRKLVWVFPGQGSQWLGMGTRLAAAIPGFRDALDTLDHALRDHVDWSLREQLEADPATSRLDEIDVVQPTIFAMQVALASVWRSWGIEADAVVGTSMGEVAAAHVAGALSLHDALKVICRRSRLMRRVSGTGAMLSVELGLAQARHAIEAHGDRVSIAASNSPISTVLSGEPAALEEIASRLRDRDVFCRMVQVDVASHSPYVDPLRADLLAQLGDLGPRPGSIPICSTVSGRLCDGGDFDASYWGDNLREPVLFDTAVAALLGSGHDAFIEVSPHPILLPALKQRLQITGEEATLVPSLRREQDDESVMLGSAAELYASGLPVDFSRVLPAGGRAVSLPTYPWQRERFWVDEADTGHSTQWATDPTRRYIHSAAHQGTHFWETDLGPATRAFLADHRVQGLTVWPAAAYVELVRSAAADILPAGDCQLEDLSFITPLVFPSEGSQRVQLILEPGVAGTFEFRVFTRNRSAAATDALLHARGVLRVGARLDASDADLDEFRRSCPRAISAADHYAAMAERQLDYGAGFRVVDKLWAGTGTALCQLRVPTSVGVGNGQAVLLDGCFQAFAQAFFSLGDTRAGISLQTTYVPVGISKIVLHAPIGDQFWCFARVDTERAQGLEGDLVILDGGGRVVAEVQGFRIQRHDRHLSSAALESLYFHTRWRREALPEANGSDQDSERTVGTWLILADTKRLGEEVRSQLEQRGARCVLVDPSQREHLQRIFDHCRDLPGDAPLRGIVHLWATDRGSPEDVSSQSLDEVTEFGCVSLLHLLQAHYHAEGAGNPRLWLVTRASQLVDPAIDRVSPAQSLLWGMGRTAAYEHPALRCSRVDLPVDPNASDIAALVSELLGDSDEDEVAIRPSGRFVARLERQTLEQARREERERDVARHDQASGYRLEMTEPGVLDDLVFRALEPEPPGPGQVQIELAAAALNFRDVMKALGLIPGQRGDRPLFGDECAGTVVAVGEGVTGLAPGDQVVAVHFERAFASTINADASLVAPRPPQLDHAEAAAIPIAFITAWCALRDLARVEKGERVLVHAAAGGVGLAAVQICQQIGAEVFATAGSPEKREHLRSLGVAHVMDSRTTAFVEDIRAKTAGLGVDVVLNSLAGELLHKSLDVLAPCGRFVEIGKRDIYADSPLGMRALRDNISLLVLDIDQLYHLRPQVIATAMTKVMAAVGDGSLRPLPTRVFDIAQAQDAFRYMAQGKHIGKIAFRFDDAPRAIEPAQREPVRIRDDATYLITGGLGALGLATAAWLIDQGARHLALVGRREAGEAGARALASLRSKGATVRTFAADIARADHVARVLDQVDATMAPLRGIIHSAGVLDDGVLIEQTAERFAAVFAPKVRGTINLHTASEQRPLDFFILFSSAAALLGPPGQANYVAANSFLDAFAHYRRQRGLVCTSIIWGPWADVGGLGSRPEYVERLAARGLAPHRAAAGFAAFAQWLPLDVAQIAIMAFDARLWCEAYPGRRDIPRLGALIAEAAEAAEAADAADGASGADRTRGARESSLDLQSLQAASAEERRALLSDYIAAQAARVLRASPSRLARNQPLKALGLDSLMAVELKNRVELDLGVSVSVAKLLLEGASIDGLCSNILENLPAPSQQAAAHTAEADDDATEWEELKI